MNVSDNRGKRLTRTAILSAGRPPEGLIRAPSGHPPAVRRAMRPSGCASADALAQRMGRQGMVLALARWAETERLRLPRGGEQGRQALRRALHATVSDRADAGGEVNSGPAGEELHVL